MGDARRPNAESVGDLQARELARRVAASAEVQTRARATIIAIDARDRATLRLLLAAHDAGVSEDELVRIKAAARELFEERFEEDVRSVMAHLIAADAKDDAPEAETP